MCEPATIALVISATATVFQGYQAKVQGDTTKETSEYNARQLENEAVRTRNVGTEKENDVLQAAAEFKSRQRAQAGASGADVGSDAFQKLFEKTDIVSKTDALRVRKSTDNQVKALEEDAKLKLATGKAAQQAGNVAFGTSILAASGAAVGGGLADKWFTPASAGRAPGAQLLM